MSNKIEFMDSTEEINWRVNRKEFEFKWEKKIVSTVKLINFE